MEREFCELWMKIVEQPESPEIRGLEAAAKMELASHLNECEGCQALVDHFQMDPAEAESFDNDATEAVDFSTLPHSVQVMHTVIDIVMHDQAESNYSLEERALLDKIDTQRDAELQEIEQAVRSLFERFPALRPVAWNLTEVDPVYFFRAVEALVLSMKCVREIHFYCTFVLTSDGTVWADGEKLASFDENVNATSRLVEIPLEQAKKMWPWTVQAIKLAPAITHGFQTVVRADGSIELTPQSKDGHDSLDAWRAA